MFSVQLLFRLQIHMPAVLKILRYAGIIFETSWLVSSMDAASLGDREIDDMTTAIMKEIENKNSKELSQSDEMIRILHLTDMHHAKTLIQHMNEAPTSPQRDIGKRAVIRALLISTWHQRLYFIIRSLIMGLIGALLTLIFVLVFGSITLAIEIPLGIFSFVFTLTVSRLFDVQIVRAVRIIVDYLASHKRRRDFVLSHF